MADVTDKEKKADTENSNAPGIVIDLNTLGINELITLTLKLEEDWKVLQRDYSILESTILSYENCKNCVENLNPHKFKKKNYTSLYSELERADLLKHMSKKSIEELKQIADRNSLEEKETEKQEKKKPLTNVDVHIPLTSLIYVPGKIVDTENFLVHMETNYYAERNAEETIEYFDNKIKKLQIELKKLSTILIEKKNEIELCKNYIQLRRNEVQLIQNPNMSVPQNTTPVNSTSTN